MKNTSHNIEPLEKRLARFQSGSPTESIETLLNSIAISYNNEIVLTPERHQTSLLFLGIHSVALTVSEILWGLTGEAGFKKFLEAFVDGSSNDTMFSNVADKIHNWRNVLAHQWLASSGYSIQYDYNMKMGYSINDNLLTINPKIYCDCYIGAFSIGGKIWEYVTVLSVAELGEAKKRIINKFVAH